MRSVKVVLQSIPKDTIDTTLYPMQLVGYQVRYYETTCMEGNKMAIKISVIQISQLFLFNQNSVYHLHLSHIFTL